MEKKNVHYERNISAFPCERYRGDLQLAPCFWVYKKDRKSAITGNPWKSGEASNIQPQIRGCLKFKTTPRRRPRINQDYILTPIPGRNSWFERRFVSILFGILSKKTTKNFRWYPVDTSENLRKIQITHLCSKGLFILLRVENLKLGGAFQYFLFSPLLGEIDPIWQTIHFQMGWNSTTT